MGWSKQDIEELRRVTHLVCKDGKESIIGTIRFGTDWNPPMEMGFPAQIVTVMPALHAFTPTGEESLIHSPQFMFAFWMN